MYNLRTFVPRNACRQCAKCHRWLDATCFAECSDVCNPCVDSSCRFAKAKYRKQRTATRPKRKREMISGHAQTQPLYVHSTVSHPVLYPVENSCSCTTLLALIQERDYYKQMCDSLLKLLVQQQPEPISTPPPPEQEFDSVWLEFIAECGLASD